MYSKILVPLDGSELAENVLPHVESIATRYKAEVHLLTIIHKPFVSQTFSDVELTEPIIEKAVGKEEAGADSYLNKVAKELKAKGIKVDTHVHMGKPAEEIAIHAEVSGCDLIVIATHGHSGPSRLAFGSSADKLLKTSCVPVLMVRPPSCAVRL